MKDPNQTLNQVVRAIRSVIERNIEMNILNKVDSTSLIVLSNFCCEVNTNYVVMNILNCIEAIDLKKSEYTTYNEKYNLYSFLPHTTYLDANVCRNYDIFRAAKSSISIYVS